MKRIYLQMSLLLAYLLLVFSCSAEGDAGPFKETSAAPMAPTKVVGSFPHDTKAFTQGLTIADGVLYESIGLEKRSAIRKVELSTGKVLKETLLPDPLFGEGLAVVGGRLIQLTWKGGKGFVYGRESLELIDTFTYEGEGWGLAFNGQHLIMSDGSSTLRLLDPTTYQQVGIIKVSDQGGPVKYLNELECVQGEILANIFPRDYLVRIDPKTGYVSEGIDLSGLLPQDQRPHREAVTNGIAYDADTNRLYVTGKLWPHIYQIELP